MLLLQKIRIDLSKRRAQAYDGGSAMSSQASGAASVIKKENQPLTEYTDCRNHILNLAISYVCKNQSVKNLFTI